MYVLGKILQLPFQNRRMKGQRRREGKARQPQAHGRHTGDRCERDDMTGQKGKISNFPFGLQARGILIVDSRNARN